MDVASLERAKAGLARIKELDSLKIFDKYSKNEDCLETLKDYYATYSGGLKIDSDTRQAIQYDFQHLRDMNKHRSKSELESKYIERNVNSILRSFDKIIEDTESELNKK